SELLIRLSYCISYRTSLALALSFFFHCAGAPRDLPSFPTRRSSDLAAVTEESTPPDRAQTTRPAPTFSLISATDASMKFSTVQVGEQPQTSRTKLRKSCFAQGAFSSSG